ncbi:MAG: hypothetical protein WCY71_08725 [Halothiobacillaceae bacterium]
MSKILKLAEHRLDGIEVEPGRYAEAVDATLDALASSDESELFNRGGVLIAVYDGKDGSPVVVQQSASALREHMARATTFKKWDGRAKAEKPTDPPLALAQTIVDRGAWLQLPDLIGFAESPLLDPADGRLIRHPGIDPKTGIYLTSGAGRLADALPQDPPSPAEATDAANRLWDDLSSFPFDDEADQVAAMAAIMGVLVAPVLSAVPLAAITATAAGTGKTKLAECIAIAAMGRPAPVMSLGRDPNEIEKRLGGLLLDGPHVACLDNLERPLEGELLNQVISQAVVSIRALGASKQYHLHARTALLATGNNLVVRGDAVRRVMLVRLDAGMENPEQRRFERDVVADFHHDRTRIISDALSITRAYLAAGSPEPEGHRPLGGFEAWDRMVRRPLIWLGFPDPLAPSVSLRADDPERQNMTALFYALQATYQDRIVTSAEIVTDANALAHRFDQVREREYPNLHAAVETVAGNPFNARQLGHILRRFRGRRADGLRLVSHERHGPTKVAGWQVVEC